MTSDEREAIAEEIGDYVVALAANLGLRDWVFTIRVNPRKKGYQAMVVPTQGRRIAQIRIGPEFKTLSPNTQRNAIVHELLHLHHRDTADLIRIRLGPKVMSQLLYDVVWAQYKELEELATDTLATAIDRMFPFPPWSEAADVEPTPQ